MHREMEYLADSNWKQTLYERIAATKAMAQNIAQSAAKTIPATEVPCAVSLSLRTPGSCFSNICSSLVMSFFTVEVQPAEYYSHFLELTEKLLDNHLDITVYEDAMREMFNVNAYKLFTLDKLILVTVRQVCAALFI